MEILLIILGLLCLLIGIIGCIVPMLPGLPAAYAGVLLLQFTDKVQFSVTQLVVWLLLVIVMQLLDYFTPMIGSKYGGGSRYGRRGCIVGTVIGLFFLPWGVLLGPFVGAVIGELAGGSNGTRAFRAGLGALIGFLMGTLLKLILCFYFVYKCVYALLA